MNVAEAKEMVEEAKLHPSQLALVDHEMRSLSPFLSLSNMYHRFTIIAYDVT
jgi:hypothetical protein